MIHRKPFAAFWEPFLALTLLLNLTGCVGWASRTATPTPQATATRTQTPAPTKTPTPSIKGTVLMDLKITGGSLDYIPLTEKVFSYAQLKIFMGESNSPYASLHIESQGEPLKADYTGHILYTGAKVEGVATYEINGKVIKREFEAVEHPPMVVVYYKGNEPTEPEDAPFRQISPLNYMVALFEILGQTEGVTPLLAAIKGDDLLVREAAIRAMGIIEDIQGQKTLVIDTLIQALKNPKLDGAAAYALGVIGDPRAIEPIIQALVAAENSESANRVFEQEQEMETALSMLTGESFMSGGAWEDWWRKNSSFIVSPTPPGAQEGSSSAFLPTKTSSAPIAQTAISPTPQAVGNPVRCGNLFEVSVVGTKRFDGILNGEKANGVYLYVQLQIKNLTNSVYDKLWPEDYEILAIVNGEQRKYPVSFDASYGLYFDTKFDANPDNLILFTDDVPIGAPSLTWVAFDVDPNGTGWTLLFHPNTWENTSDCSIAIPLP